MNLDSFPSFEKDHVHDPPSFFLIFPANDQEVPRGPPPRKKGPMKGLLLGIWTEDGPNMKEKGRVDRRGGRILSLAALWKGKDEGSKASRERKNSKRSRSVAYMSTLSYKIGAQRAKTL